jgi:hypothetical protein
MRGQADGHIGGQRDGQRDGHVDGNAVAGPLSELFAFDPTRASARCDACGSISVLARAIVFGGDHGYVLRCSGCTAVLIVVVPRPDHTTVSLTGITWLDTGTGH